MPSANSTVATPPSAGPTRSFALDHTLAFALCLGAAMLLLWPLLTGQMLFGGSRSDMFIAGYSFRLFGAESFLKDGAIPQWNPYLFGGLPYIAAMHGDIFYPTAWLRWIMPVDVAITLGMAIHFVLTGWFTYRFCRSLGLSWNASVIAGVAYELTGIVASQMSPGHDGKLFVSALAPLAFWTLLFVGMMTGGRHLIGGPVPAGQFNKNRDKLFFFWSQEFLPRNYPTDLVRRTFPTALQRNGDFSRTFDTNGALIPIWDPLNNRVPFPGNVVPSNRIDRNGHQRRVGRDNEVFCQSAFQAKSWNTKRLVVIVRILSHRRKARLGNTPRNTPRLGVLLLMMNGSSTSFSDERKVVALLKQGRHQVFKHGAAPGNQAVLT
jgi:hypothetical protein